MLAYQYIISLSCNFLLPCGHMVTVVTVTVAEKFKSILKGYYFAFRSLICTFAGRKKGMTI